MRIHRGCVGDLDTQRLPLDHRLLRSGPFAIGWAALLFAFIVFVAWPVRNAALVLWLYGSRAYFHDGVRVLPGKPVMFSTGVEVPLLHDLVTGFAAILLPGLGLTAVLILGLRVYERHSKSAHRVA
jgi:hypothetical protein